MAKLRLVVFDMDGTLVDSIALIEDVMSRAFVACDLPAPAPGAIRGLIGISLEQLLDRLHPGLSDVDLNRLVRTYKQMFLEASVQGDPAKQTPLFGGAREVLDRLSRQDNTILAVATGKSRRGLNRMFEEHEIGHYFMTSHVADDHPSKPHPSMLEAVLRDTGMSAEEAVMIGDTTYDLEMARAAGMKSIGVTWGNHPADRLAPMADALVDNFDALTPSIDQLLETAR